MISQEELNRLTDYVCRRNQILRDMDVPAMKDLAVEVGMEIPDKEEVFIAGMHIARLQLLDIPQEMKDESIAWLDEHNYTIR